MLGAHKKVDIMFTQIKKGFAIWKFLKAAIIIGVTLAIILFLLGEVFDVSLHRGYYEEHGKRIGLLNMVAASSSLLVKDSDGLPQKLLFSKAELDASIGGGDGIMETFSFLDYDYSLKITDGYSNWELGFDRDELKELFDRGKDCGRIRTNKKVGKSTILIAVSGGEEIVPGRANVMLVETPLSDIAYQLSVACTSDKFEKEIRFYGLKTCEGVVGGCGIMITDNKPKYEICVYSENGAMCKQINCELDITQLKTPCSDCKKPCYEENFEVVEDEYVTTTVPPSYYYVPVMIVKEEGSGEVKIDVTNIL